MPIDFEPRLIAFESQLERGMLMRLEDTRGRAPTSVESLSGTVLRFQYNPETITRTRTGRWDPRKKRKGKIASPQEVRQKGGMGSSALLAESEQISLKIVFDATEALLAAPDPDEAQAPPGGRRPSRGDVELGVLPQLAFLELASLGADSPPEQPGQAGRAGQAGRQGDDKREEVQPVRPDELLLILGRERIFPVVMTNLSITEQKFLPSLVPMRAEVDLKFNVLEPTEASYRVWIRSAFDGLRKDRVDRAARAAADGGVVAAIAGELKRHSEGKRGVVA